MKREQIEQIEIKFQNIRDRIVEKRKIVVIGHKRPDGDCVGSILALTDILIDIIEKSDEYYESEDFRDVKITPIVPDEIPESLEWMPNISKVHIYTKETDLCKELIQEADCIVCCDFSETHRCGKDIQSLLNESDALKICIDHHEEPDINFWDILVSEPEAYSTCEIIQYNGICDFYHSIFDYDKSDVATCLLTGIITDTKNLTRCKSEDLEYLKMGIEDLEDCGSMKRDIIAVKAYYEKSYDGIRLESHILLNNLTIYPEHKCATITLNLDEKNKFNYRHGMTDNIIERVLNIRDIRYCVYFREEKDGIIKISARGKNDYPVINICKELYNGGGHITRAGADWDEGTMQDAMSLLINSFDKYDKYL